MGFKAYLKFTIFPILFFACTEKQEFTTMLQKKFSDYDIELIRKKSFLSYENLSLLEIKHEDVEVISYYLIPSEEVDSLFVKEYLNYAFKQSCFSGVTDGFAFRSFIFNDTAFIIKPCSACAALFNKPCNDFKREFSKFLDGRNVSPLPFYKLIKS